MAGFNRLIIVGNLTRDPEYRQLTSGQAVCRLGLATNRQFKNGQTGALVQEVCFIDVDVWGEQAKSCHEYLKKGRSILVEGRLKFDSWEDQAGQKRSKHSVVANSVVFLGSGAEASEQEATDERFDTLAQNNKEIADQLGDLKAKMAVKAQSSKKPASNQTPTGEIALHDEAPFKDELPF
jgi:single-strand DNA-binding protein